MAARNTRKQAARIAVIAFVAADCAGIAYVQHRMDQTAKAAQELAYAEPLTAPAAGAEALTFTPATPMLALAAPTAAVPAIAAPTVTARPAMAAATAPSLVGASGASSLALPRSALPAATANPGRAADAPLALGAAPLAKASAHPLRAPRIAPAAGLGRAQLAVTVPAPDKVRHQDAVTGADGVFANAFSLYDEAPEAEHRFGQGMAEAGSSSNLADLVAPREDPAPIFDRAGIAPVTGQAATVDAPATADLPLDAAPAELSAIKG